MSKKYTMQDYQIFWDNGKWVAVRIGPDGVRRNIAGHNARTRKQATWDARGDRDWLNSPAEICQADKEGEPLGVD